METPQILQGIAVSEGIITARVHLLGNPILTIPQSIAEDICLEVVRFQDARLTAIRELEQLIRDTEARLGREKAEIFEAQLLMLSDLDFINKVNERIGAETARAEVALERTIQEYAQIFESMADEYLKERQKDIQDIGRRILCHLLGIPVSTVNLEITEPVIVVAHDLSPSDTAQLDPEMVLGFATDIGGRTSHSAIIARSLDIPAVVGLKDITSRVKPDSLLIVDGFSGKVFIDPPSEIIADYKLKKERNQMNKRTCLSLIDQPTVTVDGHRVELMGNIAVPADLENCLRNGAEGIGLFRSEFLYMNRKALPSEEEQFQAYRRVVEGMQGKSVIIRTLDIGGDKPLVYLDQKPELNPFLGYRAIRLCLKQKDIFKTQFRAILRSSAYGKVKIMYPMIATLEEVNQANDLLKEVEVELETKHIPYDNQIKVGIMIEIPASALIADKLAQKVDFFSIGTNDLIQYTMAADRLNEQVSYLYQPFHPAILRLIQMVVTAAHKHQKPVGMCGEMAGDIISAPVLLGLGLDELSMSPSAILPLRQLIRGLNYRETQKLAVSALALGSQEEVKNLMEKSMTVIHSILG